jgi:hypothetical protein
MEMGGGGPSPRQILPIWELAQDYEEMQVMLFGAPPEFRDILDELRDLEAEINATAQTDELGGA